jgi:hypothetical protein
MHGASLRPFTAHVLTRVLTRRVLSRSRTVGIHVLCMSTGFMAVTPLLMLFADGTSRWLRLPGSSLAILGTRLRVGALSSDTLDVLSTAWPIGAGDTDVLSDVLVPVPVMPGGAADGRADENGGIVLLPPTGAHRNRNSSMAPSTRSPDPAALTPQRVRVVCIVGGITPVAAAAAEDRSNICQSD